MESSLVAYGATLVGCVFWLTLALVASWEWIAPRRELTSSLRLRWTNNFGVWLVDDLATRWAFPMVGVAFAIFVAQRGWGLFHLLAVPSWLAAVISLPLLDLIRYWEHWLYHRVPLFWRMHRMHHTDVDCDVTAAIRSHPFQALTGTASTLVMIAALGVPPVAVVVDQVLGAASSLFTHGNVRIPPRFDAVLRWIFVTPEMHRVHHSSVSAETDSNFCQVYPWWDRLFGTYVEQPRAGHERMTIGLERFRERKHSLLPWMLALPFFPESVTGRYESTAPEE